MSAPRLLPVPRAARLTLAAAAAALALTATGCAGMDHGGGHGGSTTKAPAASAAGPAVDRAFVAGMIPHHESALEMAELAATRATSPFVKTLAADIVRTQTAEIAAMRAIDRRLAAGGAKVGSLGLSSHAMGMEMDTASLKTADPFDAAFLDEMLPHHEGALEMAEVELARGTDAETKRLAQAIVAAQTREITAMKANGATDGGGAGHHGS